jgi:TPP-dependent pyruvate/acetoin dehydrogenase alpha subunit
MTDLIRSLGTLAVAEERWEPIDISGDDPRWLVRQLQQLIVIRTAEEKIGEEVASGVIRCPCHLAIGQEAPPVAVARCVRRGDRVFGAHRSHGHFLALGGSLRSLLAEVIGKETGCSKGMGGSMHLRDIEHGLYGTVPIVAASVPIAAGAALAAKLDGSDAIAISFLGDGATEEGVFHETLNLASTLRLPVLFLIENNFFASHLHIGLRQPFDSLCRFAEAHGVPWQRVDGNDVVALNRACDAAVGAARASGGPQLIEAVTYRWRGHVGYREDNDVGVARLENLTHWKKRDPIARLGTTLIANGRLSEAELDRFWCDARGAVAEAWRQACDDPYPLPNALLDRVHYKAADNI